MPTTSITSPFYNLPPSEVDLPEDTGRFSCWLAGFFDGEGCCRGSMKRCHSKPYFRCVVAISQAHFGVLDAIRKRLGYGLVTMNMKPAKRSHKQVWRYQVHSKEDRLDFLYTILPFLQVKRNDALCAISLIEAEVPWSGRGAPSQFCRNGHARTPKSTYVSPGGHKQCRICMATRVR